MSEERLKHVKIRGVRWNNTLHLTEQDWHAFSRDDLRMLAKTAGIKLGRNKSDTIANLIAAETKAILLAEYVITLEGHVHNREIRTLDTPNSPPDAQNVAKRDTHD